MQMYAPYAGQPLQLSSPGTDAYMLDDISRQMALSQQPQPPRRYSPTSSSHSLHAHVGSPMRISKPTSTSNSPRSSMQARRRTMINDGRMAQRNQQLLEQACMTTSSAQNLVTESSMRRAARPVSWHPSTQLGHVLPQQQVFAPQQAQHSVTLSQYPFPVYNEADLYAQYQHLPPTPATYSAYNSPTGLSPLALPYSTFGAPQYATKSFWTTSAPMMSSTISVSPDSECPGLLESTNATEQHTAAAGTSQGTSTQWDSLVQGATPPTPDSYPSVTAAPEPMIPLDEAMPYRSLDDDEDDGEILVGMGLYDLPEKTLGDYSINGYRSSATSLFGTCDLPEPKGKGLKLEETWVPPPKEDDDDEDSDSNSDDDADAHDEE